MTRTTTRAPSPTSESTRSELINCHSLYRDREHIDNDTQTNLRKHRGGSVFDAVKRRVDALIKSLGTLIARAEREVQGLAVPVLDASLEAIKQAKPDDPVVASLVELMSADFIGVGEPIRAADMLVVVEQLDAATGAGGAHHSPAETRR